MDGKLLEGKVALETGAGRGVGRDIALMMAAHGTRGIVNDFGTGGDGGGLDVSPARSVVKEIQAAGGKASSNFGSVAELGHAAPSLKPNFCGLDRASDVFTWEPV